MNDIQPNYPTCSGNKLLALHVEQFGRMSFPRTTISSTTTEKSYRRNTDTFCSAGADASVQMTIRLVLSCAIFENPHRSSPHVRIDPPPCTKLRKSTKRGRKYKFQRSSPASSVLSLLVLPRLGSSTPRNRPPPRPRSPPVLDVP